VSTPLSRKGGGEEEESVEDEEEEDEDEEEEDEDEAEAGAAGVEWSAPFPFVLRLSSSLRCATFLDWRCISHRTAFSCREKPLCGAVRSIGATCKKLLTVAATICLRMGTCPTTSCSIPRGSAKRGSSPDRSTKKASISGSMGIARTLWSAPFTLASAANSMYSMSFSSTSARFLSPRTDRVGGQLISLCTASR
jgi:hypothetical protein